MKQSLIIINFFVALNSFGQIPNYFNNNPSWHCGEWNSDQWNFPSEPYEDHCIYYLHGDTLAFGFTYHKVFKKGTRDYNLLPGLVNGTFDFQTDYYVRQEGKSIRFFTLQDNVDSLLVCYDYSIGDTVKGYIFQGCGHAMDTIQKIDSVFINSEYRKVFYLDTISGPVITEGIGHQLEINGVLGELLLPMCPGIGFDYYLHCYGQNEIPLWDSQGNGGDCHLNVNVEENSEVEFQIFPNPTTNYITIITNSSELLFVKVYDINVRLLLQTFNSHVSLENFERGTYFILISDKQGNSKREKLILN